MSDEQELYDRCAEMQDRLRDFNVIGFIARLQFDELDNRPGVIITHDQFDAFRELLDSIPEQ